LVLLVSHIQVAKAFYINVLYTDLVHRQNKYYQFRLTASFQVNFQCFIAVGWAAGRASGLQKTEWWGAGVVICLVQGADLHTAQLMPLPLTASCFSKM